MGLYDMTDGNLVAVEKTTFAVEGVWERTHLQAAIRDNIALLGDDLLVVAEEFGGFNDANRRIDLLCVDREARPVVVELKRTTDGGHMELQALRYAAMVSALTFDDLVGMYERLLGEGSKQDSVDAREALASFLEDAGGEEAVIRRDVRIILASADFGKEITTTALWLNDVFGTDIRCVRLIPYRIEGRLLLDVQQVIPLPEAEELTIRLRRRESAVRVAKASSQDWTQYVVKTPSHATEPLRKRRAILVMVQAVHDAGVPASDLHSVLGRKLFDVDGTLAGEGLLDAFLASDPKAEKNLHRWFLDDPIHDAGRTLVVSKMWGLNTEDALDALIALAPDAGLSYSPVAV